MSKSVVLEEISDFKVDLTISLKTLGKVVLIVLTTLLSPKLKISFLISSISFVKSKILLLDVFILSWAINFNSNTLKCLLNKCNNTFLVKTK